MTSPQKPAFEPVVFMLDGNLGVYLPQTFIELCDLSKFSGISESDRATCAAGRAAEHYWDAWASILDNARFVDADGNEFTLQQDGDLFAYCWEWIAVHEARQFLM